jgi:Calcineurin-like phosphoesterase
VTINRRQFLLLSGLGGLGAAGFGGLLWSASSSAIPSLPKEKPLLRFGVMADTGTGSMQQYAVGRALLQHHRQRPISMVLLAGDNIYTNGEFNKIKEAFTLPYQDLINSGVKFYACLGNHDVRGDVCGTDRGERCAATSTLEIRNEEVNHRPFNMGGQRYYTFRKGDIQFFATETNSLANPTSPTRNQQLQWLDRELGKSTAKIKIVFGHHPIYSMGVYGDNAVLIKDVEPILLKHQVKLWVDGHDHNYQRIPHEKITYLVSGGGGAGLYGIGTKDGKKLLAGEVLPNGKTFQGYAESIHSCATVDVYADRLYISGINSKGEVIDRGIVML